MNDYSGSTIYMNLCKGLDELGYTQIIYHPIRDKKRIGKNQFEFKNSSSKIIYAPILNVTTDRILYPAKIKKIIHDIENKVDVGEIDVIHAHTWYSDGGAAYQLSKKYKIPYYITIQNTDINFFHKYLIYARPFGLSILLHARKIVLMSTAYQQRVLNLQGIKKHYSEIQQKLQVILSGVDDFWIENAASKKKDMRIDSQFNLLYIGKFAKGKNVYALLQAVEELNEAYQIPAFLHVVGGGGRDDKRVKAFMNQHPEICKFHGAIYEKEKLQAIFAQCAVFAMPSMKETFGLVYVEALLQGLPILYTQNEGIDGIYEDSVGEKVVYGTKEEIAQKLKLLYTKYADYYIDVTQIAVNHAWSKVAQEYQDLYSD